ncbi:uncharacterized protein SRS1_15068 [Sporisorium reilianum f. sp. reilianum]|uniref:CFEM domain-containing protein n=1 Tax=Sporisorium reilianum f. sp. reilianum TaxID=72559 RepID=A0A2N8UHK8_9BASI|nr:uncharacterized protein SRS1_15068 [Sporisorium reilianum f. sp. reilianum]
MVATRRSKFSFALLLLIVFVAAASVSAGDASSQSGGSSAPQLEASPAGDSGDDGGSISAPANGNDAKSIIASSSTMMGTPADATDGDDDDNKDASKGGKQGQNGRGGHHGQCVIGCATKSTEGVGCGTDMSKPECFCKSENFIDQTFACINATCPQQFHGAAGVIKSICSVAGAPSLQIPGYNSSNNLENMPTINEDPKNNGTNTTATGTTDPGSAAPPSGSENSGGITSTFSMPVGMQTPTTSGSSGASTGGTNGSTASTGSSSGATRVNEEAIGAMIAVSIVAVAASVGAWTLF